MLAAYGWMQNPENIWRGWVGPVARVTVPGRVTNNFYFFIKYVIGTNRPCTPLDVNGYASLVVKRITRGHFIFAILFATHYSTPNDFLLTAIYTRADAGHRVAAGVYL
jgi:hypothetical protein